MRYLSQVGPSSVRDKHYLTITTKSCLSSVDSPLPTIELLNNDSTVVDKTFFLKLDKVIGVNSSVSEDKC